jgi:hypothetical protein
MFHVSWDFTKIVVPLTQLTSNDKFKWNIVDVVKDFKFLKNAFMIIPILIHANPSKPFFLEANVSKFVLGVVLF